MKRYCNYFVIFFSPGVNISGQEEDHSQSSSRPFSAHAKLAVTEERRICSRFHFSPFIRIKSEAISPGHPVHDDGSKDIVAIDRGQGCFSGRLAQLLVPVKITMNNGNILYFNHCLNVHADFGPLLGT